MERTLILLKPEAFEKRIAGNIITMIENKDYHIEDAKIIKMDDELIEAHYGHLKNDNYPKEAFPRVYKQMINKRVMALIVCGNDVIAGMRKMMGATKVEDRQPGTIRFMYSNDLTLNVIHGSDSVLNAENEIKRFFN